MPLITLFSAPKPFTDPHIAMIQRNAIQSWKALGEDVEVLLLGDEEGLEQAAQDLGTRWIPDLERNSDGTPLISSMFEQAIKNGQGELMAIVNADIILLPDFVEMARSISEQGRPFLLMGQRWDLDIRKPLSFAGEWQSGLHEVVQREGKLHKSKGSDYFIFSTGCISSFSKICNRKSRLGQLDHLSRPERRLDGDRCHRCDHSYSSAARLQAPTRWEDPLHTAGI